MSDMFSYTVILLLNENHVRKVLLKAIDIIFQFSIKQLYSRLSLRIGMNRSFH